MLPTVTFHRPDPRVEDYVEVSVRTDAERVPVGTWMHTNQTFAGLLRLTIGYELKRIDKVWDEALGYAVSHDLEVIYVDDPSSVFPVEKLGLASTIFHASER